MATHWDRARSRRNAGASRILGFENEWQAAAIPYGVSRELPSRATIKVAPPVYLVAMKLEAFKSRGKGDFLASRDFEDIVRLIDGRLELLKEVSAAEDRVRAYIAAETARLLAEPRLMDGLAGAVRGDAASQERIDVVVLPAMRGLAGAAL